MDKFLDKLYQTYEQEIRGSNKPIEDVDRRPNYIGMCINMFETKEQKIQCLRIIKEQTAMNPFYQHRIDRFIDAITNTWEPTNKPGFVEYIRGEKDSALVEGNEINDYLNYITDQGTPSGPPPKEIQLKASGAEQDDEEPPTDESTKEFEKKLTKEELRKVINEFDPVTATAAAGSAIGTALGTAGVAAGKLVAAHPKAAMIAGGVLGAKAMKAKLEKEKRARCTDKHRGYPERIQRCMVTGQ